MIITFPPGHWPQALDTLRAIHEGDIRVDPPGPLFVLAEGSYRNPNYTGVGPGRYTRGTLGYKISTKRTGEQVLLIHDRPV